MYDELVKQLREADEKSMCGECGLNLHTGATKKGVLFAEAADAIEELSAICEEQKAQIILMAAEIEEQQPHWISVTERLPEEMDQSRGEWSAEIRPSDDVLVWLSPEKRQSVAWYSHSYNEWTTVDENTVYCFEQITHWKPLPEPPKEE